MDNSYFFDDVVSDEYGTWTQLCINHAKEPYYSIFGKISECASSNISCGCKNCKNKAEYYLDFYDEK